MMNLLLIAPSMKKRHYVDTLWKKEILFIVDILLDNTSLVGSLFMANHKRIYYINAKIKATRER